MNTEVWHHSSPRGVTRKRNAFHEANLESDFCTNGPVSVADMILYQMKGYENAFDYGRLPVLSAVCRSTCKNEGNYLDVAI